MSDVLRFALSITPSRDIVAIVERMESAAKRAQHAVEYVSRNLNVSYGGIVDIINERISELKDTIEHRIENLELMTTKMVTTIQNLGDNFASSGIAGADNTIKVRFFERLISTGGIDSLIDSIMTNLRNTTSNAITRRYGDLVGASATRDIVDKIVQAILRKVGKSAESGKVEGINKAYDILMSLKRPNPKIGDFIRAFNYAFGKEHLLEMLHTFGTLENRSGIAVTKKGAIGVNVSEVLSEYASMFTLDKDIYESFAFAGLDFSNIRPENRNLVQIEEDAIAEAIRADINALKEKRDLLSPEEIRELFLGENRMLNPNRDVLEGVGEMPVRYWEALYGENLNLIKKKPDIFQIYSEDFKDSIINAVNSGSVNNLWKLLKRNISRDISKDFAETLFNLLGNDEKREAFENYGLLIAEGGLISPSKEKKMQSEIGGWGRSAVFVDITSPVKRGDITLTTKAGMEEFTRDEEQITNIGEAIREILDILKGMKNTGMNAAKLRKEGD